MSHAGAVHGQKHHFFQAAEFRQERCNFISAQHNRQPFGLFGWRDIEEGKFPLQHGLIEEQQRALGLILGAWSDVALDGQLGEKGGDFFFAEAM